MAASVTSAFGSLSPTLKAGVVGAGIGAGIALLSGGGLDSDTLFVSLYQGGVASAGAVVAPMLSDDPMLQLAGAGATGVAAGMVVSMGAIPGASTSILADAAIPAASLYLSRNL